jgi:hypothetical protein
VANGGPHDAEHRSTHPTTDCGSAALGMLAPEASKLKGLD